MLHFARVAAMLAIIALPGVGSGLSPDESQDLTGTWVLDPDMSDDPRQVMDGSERDGQTAPRGGFGIPGGGGRRGGMSGPGGMGGPGLGGRRTDPDEAARVRDVLRDALAGSARMTISQEGDAITIATPDGATQRIHVDGGKRRERAAAGVEVERKARWDDGQLVMDVSVKDSPARYKETWRREGGKLTISVKAEGPQGGAPIVARRVYQREGGDQ